MTGEEFKIIYKRMGFKTSKVSKALNITPQSVGSWFTYKNISTDILEKLCSISEYKINDFYKDTEYEYVPEELSREYLTDEELKSRSNSELYKIVTDLRKELREEINSKVALQVDNALLANKLKELTSENAVRELLKKVG